MYRLTLIIVLAILFTACHKPNQYDCTPDNFELYFSSDKKIDTVRQAINDPKFVFYNYSIATGDKEVFTYKHTFQDCPDIADDEGSLTILFEVPANSTAFLIKDSVQMLESKVIVSPMCECQPNKPVFVRKGTIEGTKVNNSTWRVKFELTMPWHPDAKLNFQNTFEQK